MDTPSNITDNLDQADEEILIYTVSDEALEATTGIERPPCGWSFDSLMPCWRD
jgi:hypothetical protein